MSPAASEAPNGRLSREVIVDAYVRIAEADGTGDITLRRLGRELGVDPTAVYRHFRDKDEILATASDRLLSEASEGFTPTGRWREDLRALMLVLRSAFLSHPHALSALQLSPVALPHGAWLVERCIGCLRSAGLSDDEASLAFEALEDYTVGAAMFDAQATQESLARWRQLYRALPPEEFPNLSATAARLYLEPEAAFAFGLDLMLEAIAVKAKSRTRKSRAATTQRRTA